MNLTRREFIALCSSSALAAFLAACGETPTATLTPAPTMTSLPSATSNASDDKFGTLIGAKIDPQFEMVTSRKQYQVSQSISFRIFNQKSDPIYFEDYSFGLRAYIYDTQLQTWSRRPLRFRLLSNERMILYPGLQALEDSSFVFAVNAIQTLGKVRLVCVGWTDPSDPKNSIIATYTEIEIYQ
jgi:hypothetical protein